MENKQIINLSTSVFGLCLILGSICLLGGMITRAYEFAVGGYLLLVFGGAVNLVLVLFFLIYGMMYRSKFSACMKAIGILSTNIPIAVLYAFIGLYLFD